MSAPTLERLKNRDVTMVIPADVSDRPRLLALTRAFHAVRLTDYSWVFTRARGEKCLALYLAGFRHEAGYFYHRASHVPFELSEAVRTAEVMGHKRRV